MVNMNASKKVRYISSVTNQNQGGGNKKAGFPYQVGRTMWSNIYMGTKPPAMGMACCSLKSYQINKLPMATVSRPIGRTGNASYWNIH